MTDHSNKEAARDFVAAMKLHHETLLASDDEEINNAVVIKMVALATLAFGIPPIAGKPLDVDDALAKLKNALEILQHKESSQSKKESP